MKKYFRNYKIELVSKFLFGNKFGEFLTLPIHEVINLTSGDNLPKSKMIEGDYDVYGGGGITGHTHHEYNIDEKTIGIGRVGARCGCVFHVKEKSWVTDNALLVKDYSEEFDLNFLLHYLNYCQLNKYANNSLQPVISKKRLSDVQIPQIPLSMQKEIGRLFDSISQGKDVEELVKKFEVENSLKFEQYWVELNKKVSDQLVDLKNLRQAILQEAIQGKLVAQDPTDEPATGLLARIKAEKERLIKEKKIKKEKPLLGIKEEEVPFDLPEGWVWCRLNDITSKLGSGSTPRGGKSAYSKQGIKFLRSQNIYNDGLKLNDVVFINEETNQKMKGTIVRPNDLLLNITGGSIGRAVRIPKDFDIANVSQHVSIIRPVISELSDYLHFLILSDYFQKSIISSVTGAGREGLPKYKMLMFLIPLPPLKEIPRTINKVRELLSLIDNLEQQTQAQQQDAEILMQGVLAEAFS